GRPVLRGSAEGHPVHRAGQPVRHAPAVHAQHHRLHGRLGVRAWRDHQTRLDDDQRRRQLRGPPPVAHHRRVLRRRALRHVRTRLRAALPLLLAQRQIGRHGRPATRRRGHLGRRGGVGRPGGGDGPGHDRRAQDRDLRADRVRVPARLPVRDALRRRRDRSPGHPGDPRSELVRDPLRRRLRDRPLRRLPDVRNPPMNTPDTTAPTTTITSVLVANRGEIARRVHHTARTLGMATVAVFSDADSDAPHAREADAAVRLPGHTPTETYLRGDLVIEAARAAGADATHARAAAAAVRLTGHPTTETYLRGVLVIDAARAAGADAIHPGYGFLSENAGFARDVIAAGLTWVGPPPEAIDAMGSKIEAKKRMAAAGVPMLTDLEADDVTEDLLPVLVKASAGGGGRGMRIVRTLDSLHDEIAAARREAGSAFGDEAVFCERYLERGRHIEVQIMADRNGTVWAVGERECSIQRRHQKVIEEAPSPLVEATPGMRDALYTAARDAASAIGYTGAGTVEFLATDSGEFFFLEMNTRLQVEHPVTEATTGL